MTETVIDSSILAAYILKEEGWEDLEELIYTRKPYTLDLALKEAANALWKRATLIGDLDKETINALLNSLIDISKIVLRLEPQDKYLKPAFEISLKHNTPIYDSLFLALALGIKGVLASRDKRQLDIAENLNIPTLHI